MTKERIEELRNFIFGIISEAKIRNPYAAQNFADLLAALEEREKARPLIEAVMGAGEITFVGRSSPGADRIIRAALKFREGRAK